MRLVVVLAQLRRVHASSPHEEQLFLEGAMSLIEDVIRRKPGEPMPGLHDPAESAHG